MDEGEYESSEQDVGNIPTQKHIVVMSGNDEWKRQQALARERREKMTPRDRIEQMEKAVKGFRIMSAGDGLLRGGFPRLPTGVENLMKQMENLAKTMSKFNLIGDNLNVTGSFDKGYSVSRENPCDQQQVNRNPQ